VLSLLSYPPILRGLAVLLVASATFPVAGVWVVRLNLLPYRFMLMHGALLGGAMGLALGLAPLPSVLLVNLLLVLVADYLSNHHRLDAGLSTIVLMVASLGGAMAIISAAGVPAQDAMGLLWGSLFAVSPAETAATAVFCAALIVYARAASAPIAAVIFDRDVAFTSGVNDAAVMRSLMIITGLTVAFAMRIVGALLLDALLLMPVLIASLGVHSLAQLYRRSALIGLGVGIAGFVIALAVDLPVGAAAALTGAVILGIALLVRHNRRRKELRT